MKNPCPGAKKDAEPAFVIVEYEELRKGYMDLCKANDENKKLLLELATQQKHQNTFFTKKIRNIERRLP